jgi:POT family proton-dependent oligopeptide transporter
MMALGHFFLTVEHPMFFYGSLSLIIMGNGFFKPNISTFVGKLYEEGDIRRDSGFTIFYMGINIGGAVAPLFCAWLAEVYGWHYGFLSAGLGMLIGLMFFKRGLKKDVFGDKGLVPSKDLYDAKVLGLDKGKLVTILAFSSVPLFALLIRYNQYEHYLVWLTTFVIIIALYSIYKSVDSIAQKRLITVVYYTVLMTLFWAIFEQAGSSLTLFADRNVNLIGINAAQTNSINGGFIILLAIPFSWMWAYLSKRKINPNSAIKAGLGLVLLGLGFVIFGASANSADEFGKTPMFYLVLGYFVLTVGELFISPIGLSKMTELSPIKYLSFLMGLFFTSSFYGHFFAGKIAKMTTVVEGEINMFSRGILGQFTEVITGLSTTDNYEGAFQQLYSYVSVFTGFGIIAITIGLFCILISPIIKNLMCGVE